jgi:hypothetical protein
MKETIGGAQPEIDKYGKGSASEIKNLKSKIENPFARWAARKSLPSSAAMISQPASSFPDYRDRADVHR